MVPKYTDVGAVHLQFLRTATEDKNRLQRFRGAWPSLQQEEKVCSVSVRPMWMMKINQWDKRTVDEFFVLQHSRYLHILQRYYSLTRRKQTLRKILHKQLITWNFRMCGSRFGSFKVPNYKFEMKFRTNSAVTAPGHNITIASKQTSCHMVRNIWRVWQWRNSSNGW